jgi:hypothetical protein
MALSRFRAFWFICVLDLLTFCHFSLAWGLLFDVWTILTVFLQCEIVFLHLIIFCALFKTFMALFVTYLLLERLFGTLK